MHTLNRRLVAAILAAALLLSVGALAIAKGEQEKAGPVTLEVWLWKSYVAEQNTYMERQLHAFGAATGHKVNVSFLPAEEIYKKQLAAVEANIFPDICEIWVQNIDQFNRMGVLADITDTFDALNAKSPFSPLLGTMVTLGGKKVGIPFNTSAEAQYWRKDVLDDMGLKPADTWEELKATAKKITEAGQLYGFATALGRPATDGEKFIQSVMWAFGGSVMDSSGKPAFKSAATARAFDYLVSLVREKIMPEGVNSWDDGGNNRAYQTKTVACVQNTASVYNYIRQNDPELLKNTNIVPVASGPKGRYTDTVPHALGVSAKSKNLPVAKALMQYIMDEKLYQGWIEQAGAQIQPVYSRLVDNPFWSDPYRKAFIEAAVKYGAYEGWPGPASAASGEIFGTYVLGDTIQKILIENWSTDKALDWGVGKIDEIYQRWK
jgi:ABC-type glycerol-3-phosphate transport system substrate-binding protein